MARALIETVQKTKLSVSVVARTIVTAEPVNYLATIDGQTVLVTEVPQTRLKSAILIAKTKLVSAVLAEPGRVLNKILGHIANAIETVKLFFTKALTSESITTTDTNSIDYGKGILTSVNIQEQVIFSFVRNTLLQDYSYASDTNYSITFTRPLPEDVFSASDSINIFTFYTRHIYDTVTLTDDINGAAVDDDQNTTFFKVTLDQTSISDISYISSSKPLISAGSFSDTGFLLSQNYSQQHYFAEDYTGTMRTFT